MKHFHRQNINDILLTQFRFGGPAMNSIKDAFYRREQFQNFSAGEQLEKFLNDLEQFFAARTDQHRLANAQTVCNMLLENHDYGEFIEVRELVAKMELLRSITFSDQRDHTAHTLYLFLMGIWLFDNVPKLRESFRNHCKNNLKGISNIFQNHLKQPDVVTFEDFENNIADVFVFQWIYASLLHDIGYIFSELNNKDTDEYKEFIFDKIFSVSWFKEQNTAFMDEEKKTRINSVVDQAFIKFLPYQSQLIKPEDLYTNPSKIVERLSQIPWLEDYKPEDIENFSANTLELFDNRLTHNPIKEFAETIATQGYKGDGKGMVDHAIASGLILFQYSSFYYYILELINRIDQSSYNDLTMGFSYVKYNLYNEILPACRAVAYHNMNPSETKYAVPKFNIEDEPLLFLSVLCDELASWERFPVGINKIVDISKNAKISLQSPDIEIKISSNSGHQFCDFLITNSVFDVEGMKSALNGKLENWSDIVNITNV